MAATFANKFLAPSERYGKWWRHRGSDVHKGIQRGTPWIHLDIAGTAWQDDVKPWNAKRAMGVAVRTLVDLARKFGSNGSSAK
jgi:hypothetical protein